MSPRSEPMLLLGEVREDGAVLLCRPCYSADRERHHDCEDECSHGSDECGRAFPAEYVLPPPPCDRCGSSVRPN